MTLPPRARSHLGTLALVAAGLSVSGAVRADEMACVAASENEVAFQRAGRLKDALKQLALCSEEACSREVRVECARRVVKVEAALPTIVVRATDATGNDLVAVKVTLDGAPFATVLDGRAVAVDPGTHTLRLESAGHDPVSRTLVFGEAEKDRHVTVVMTALTPVVAPAAASASGGGGAPVRTAGFVTGGVGLAGIVIGSVLGGLAISGASRAKGECIGMCSVNTNPVATHDMQTAGTYADASTGMFIAGGVLVAGGVAMVLFGGTTSRATAVTLAPAVLARGGGLGLRGAW